MKNSDDGQDIPYHNPLRSGLQACNYQTERSWLEIMVLNTTFNNIFSYIVAVNIIDGGNRSTRKKTTDLPQVTDKL